MVATWRQKFQFFHKKTEQRRKVNTIQKLKDGNGAWWRGQENMERILLTYFSDLFKSSLPEHINEEVNVVQGKIKEEQFRWCEEKFSATKVKEALF